MRGRAVRPYAANREAGIRAAYDAVRGTSGPWHDRTVQLRNGLTLTVTQPEGDSRISILFLRLADGGVNGGGYQRTGWESLNELIVGDLPVLHTIDTDVEVTLEQLNSMVVEVAAGYHATSVLASLPGFADGRAETTRITGRSAGSSPRRSTRDSSIRTSCSTRWATRPHSSAPTSTATRSRAS